MPVPTLVIAFTLESTECLQWPVSRLFHVVSIKNSSDHGVGRFWVIVESFKILPLVRAGVAIPVARTVVQSRAIVIALVKDFVEIVACLGVIRSDSDASSEAEQPVLVAAVNIFSSRESRGSDAEA